MRLILFTIFILWSSVCIGAYVPINRTSYGYINYASYMGSEFLASVEAIAKKYSLDSNELLALIHIESFYNQQAFNINWNMLRSGVKYHASGSGCVGILQFDEAWCKPYTQYQVSCMSRLRQLQILNVGLQRHVDMGNASLLSTSGGICCIIFGGYCNPIAYSNWLRNPYLGHAGAIYFTNAPTTYNSGRLVPYNKSTRTFETHYDVYMRIEREFYRKKHLNRK